MKTIFLLFGFVVLMLSAQIKAAACVCVDMGEPLEQKVKNHLKNAKAILMGEVVEIADNPNGSGIITKIKVKESWKGSSSEELVLFGERSSCDFHFTVGKKYLVYVYEWEGKLTTGECVGNRKVEDALEELKVLGEGRKPKKKKA